MDKVYCKDCRYLRIETTEKREIYHCKEFTPSRFKGTCPKFKKGLKKYL